MEQNNTKIPIEIIPPRSKGSLKIDNARARHLAGLVRISHDLDLIAIMTRKVIDKGANRQEKEPQDHLLDHQGIIITYRKCFLSDTRNAKLNEKHLKDLTLEQLNFHERLLHLGNQVVAHPECTCCDVAHVYLVLDENDPYKAIKVDIEQYLFQPLAYQEFEKILELVAILNHELKQNIEQVREKIIEKYNSDPDSFFIREE